MGIGDSIVIAIVALIVLAIIIHLVRQKKKGLKCIGCPAGCKACENAKSTVSCCCGCNMQHNYEDKTE